MLNLDQKKTLISRFTNCSANDVVLTFCACWFCFSGFDFALRL